MIYIIGHKNPDTDSIASSMAYAELKNKLGVEAEARRLGTLNEECKFATRFFNVEAPSLLTDARVTLKDIELDSPVIISPDTSCIDALNLINPTHLKTACIYDNGFKGIVSLSDLSNIYLLNAEQKSHLLSRSDVDIISVGLKGEIKSRNSLFKTNGKVAIYVDDHIQDYKDTIVLTTYETQIIKLLDKKPGLIIYNGESLLDEIVELCAKKDISLIRTSMSLEEILLYINHCIPVKLLMKEEVITFHESEYVNDVSNKLLKSRFRSYPVLNESSEVLGLLSRYHLSAYPKNKMILVDHSSFIQSINHLDRAEILEVVDHHHIGGLITNYPVYYRNEILGSTCTIIYKMFKENDVVPSTGIAGMMLSAIISDTLFFKSKTTTPIDMKYADELAKIAGVDLESYAEKLLSSGADIRNARIEALVESDLKQYSFKNIKIAVGQTNYSKISDIESRINEFREYLKSRVDRMNLDLLVMMFTSIKNEETLFLYYGNKSELFSSLIEKKIDDHYGFDSVIVSRKQQLIPLLTNIVENS